MLASPRYGKCWVRHWPDVAHYDHENLTVRHNGIDRRLTDVHGDVVKAVLA